ncbi:MAG: autotransporter domain-containing protein, partial [Psychrilyobacter sp.]|uniref:autotransporter domain-containing protein n=1 Tax=Psychrilyobacter sp. TaxID=2586924 RepID=UPI003C715425
TGLINNKSDYGMSADGIGSSINNRGNISNDGNYGMSALNGSIAINDTTGHIKNKGDYGMSADGIGSSINNKEDVSNDGNYGMSAFNGSIAINETTGLINNKSDYGMSADGIGSSINNRGNISNDGNYGMSALNGSVAINETTGHIKNKSDYGMSAIGIGSIAMNKGTISSTGDKKLYGENGASLSNSGTIDNIINGQSGMFLDNAGDSKNTGIINVTDGIGVKANNSNFYNSGTINASGQTAIEMDNNDSILELGAGSILRGRTDGLVGEDTLILSGIGSVDVGNNSVNNFEKLVATGDITAKGTYNLTISNGNGYKTSAFGSSTIYNLNDATGAPGNLIVDGTINAAVDYDGITRAGTDKTGKIIANTITKPSNGHIILINGGTSNLGIVDEAEKINPTISGFRINGIATVGGAQVIDPDLFTVSGKTGISGNWQSATVGDRAGINGSILLDQKYLKVMSTNTNTNTNTPSKILIPRNRLDLDNMNELTRITNNLTNLDSSDLKIGEDKFTIDYLGTKGNSKFKGIQSYNYDYDVNSDGVATTYMYKLSKKFSLGTGFSYENSDVTYHGLRIGNTNISAPEQNHKEKIDSYNTQLFGKYKSGDFNLTLGLGYGLSAHEAKTNFASGIKTGKYNSYVLKTGIEGSYNYKLTSTLDLVPTLGVDYINVSEDSFKYRNGIKLENASGDGYVGTLALKLRNSVGKFRWDIGAGYKYNSEETFHNTRKVSGYPLEVEKLYYDKNTLLLTLNGEYDISEDFLVRAGYECENNRNYRNNNINIGFTYKFNSIEDFVPIININEHIYFKFDSYSLNEENKKVIKKIANNLKSAEGTLNIEGHTDSVGTKKYNQKLSEQRANVVSEVIKNDLKNNKVKVITKGLGEEFPIFPNDTESHKKGNRAVNIKFDPTKAEKF